MWWETLGWWSGYKNGEHDVEVFFAVENQSIPVAVFCRVRNNIVKFEILNGDEVVDNRGIRRHFYAFPSKVTHPLSQVTYMYIV